MFFFRRDSKLKKTAARRLKSPRGSAYLEFALVLPIVVMVISAMIEFTSLWDAKIMANHAAWTVGRIATVRAGERDAAKSSESLIGKKPASVVDLLNPEKQIDGMYVATTLLMSTCSMGSMHGSSADLAKDWISKWIDQGMSALRELIETKIKSEITSLVQKIAQAFPFDLGDNVISQIVTEVMNKIVEGVTKPLAEALTNLIAKMIPAEAYTSFDEFLNSNRALRQVVYAADRMATYDVISVKERDDAKIPAFSRVSLYGGGQLDLPATYDTKSTYDEWMVKTYSGWPPNNQSQKMIDVTIKWPFERAWMFPVLASPTKTTEISDDVPTAVGRALFYPQPTLKNANLYSEGAEAFDPGTTNSYTKAIDEMKKLYSGFLNIVLLSYKYRLLEETVGPYDSDTGSGSYKGIGRGVSGDVEESAYYALDGLVLWMGRSPDDPGQKSNWQSKSAPEDYKKCFEELTGESDETCLFWYGKAFWALKRPALKNLLNRAYKDKEWFFWGDNTHRHLRVKHGTPSELFDSWRNSYSHNPPWYALLNGGTIDGASSEINGTFTDGNLKMSVSESDFKSALSRYAAGVGVAYSDWKRLADTQPTFAANANAMISFAASSADDLKQREQEVLKGTFATAAKKDSDIRTLERACRDEIAASIGGSGEEADYSSMGFFDFGDDDEDIINDPEKAVEKMKEKLETLKKTVVNDVIAIDEAEEKSRSAYTELLQQFYTTTTSRREKLLEWAAKTAAAMGLAASTDPNVIAQVMRKSFPMSGDLTTDTTLLESNYKDYIEALTALYDAELQLAKDLGLKSGGSKDKEKGDVDPSGGGVPEDDPYRPKESDSESGSDNDGAGDYWRRKSGGGWAPDPGGKDDI